MFSVLKAYYPGLEVKKSRNKQINIIVCAGYQQNAVMEDEGEKWISGKASLAKDI